MKRERWKPWELTKITMELWKMKKIEGLFLSSCVERDPDFAVEKEIEAVEILRKKGFDAYVHLRIMPGVSRDLVKQSVRIADRVGINIEFPRAEYYNDMKIFLSFKQDIIKRVKWICSEVRKAQKEGKCKAGLDSQMVVGASNETDKEILDMSEWLYNRLNASRVYYSAFEPIHNTPLENKRPENRWREYRLYQCSFLIQRYGYRAKEFVLEDGLLPLNFDPKLLIARQTELKVDLNNSKFEELIRIPGVGIKTAKKILENRPIKKSIQLKELGILKRALPFIEFKKEIQTNLNCWD